jgi:lipopolysaccharide/colanic/teichoic acid biosynthesis glycosyltransferase
MDFFGALCGLLVFSPLMIAAALAIKLTSRGPIIFKQKRAGLGGKPFTMYKFRTMIVGAESLKKSLLSRNEQTGPVFKMKNDPRVTWVGRFLRKTSIDEFPQFLNVLKGDMSLVGPRPPTLDEVPHYRNWQHRRLEITPGLTCFWQIMGRAKMSFEEWVRKDILYINSMSLLVDLKLLILTIPAVILRRGAH